MVINRFRLLSIIYPFIVGLYCSLIVMGCASQGQKHALAEVDPCIALDSLYASSGFESPLSMAGRITFDVDQYRIRGQFTLTAGPNGEMGFDFSSSVMLGSRHEDISMSMVGGIVRVLDRERGLYYEGEEVDEKLKEMLGLNLDVNEIVSLVLGAPPTCGDLKDKKISLSRSGEVVFTSRLLHRDVRIVFDEKGRTIRKFMWPLAFDSGKAVPLEVDYTWEPVGGERRVLMRLVLYIPEEGWRIKLVAI